MAEEVAHKINKAIKGLGTDDEALVNAITSHTNEQLFKINLEYQKKYQKTLPDAIRSDTSGDYSDLLVSLVIPTNEYRALVLRNAIKGAGTDEDAIIDVFAHATNEQITATRTAYEYATGTNLEKDIADDLSGHFEKGILSLLHLFRVHGPHPEKAVKDADEIYKKGEGKWGTDDDFFVKFFTEHTYEHIKLVDAAYQERHGHNLKTAVDKETSGHYGRLLKALVTPPEKYYAQRIHDSIAGLGTKDKVLKRIVVLNNDRHSLSKVAHAYQELYKESLIDAIKGDTSGWYEKTFLGLFLRPV